MGNGSCCATGGSACPAIGVGAVMLLVLRAFLGGVLLYAAALKLQDPQQFAFAIRAYQIIPEGAKHLVTLGTFVVPWLELIVGGMLVIGLWGRAAAIVGAGLMALFVYAVWSVIARDLNVTCGCFGKLKGPFGCEGPIGMCKLAENLTLLASALALTAFGPGSISVDGLCRRRAC
jgi:putative oxidoreductase